MAGNKKTLLIISPGFPSDEGDTSCLPTQQLLVKALRRNYPELNIIVIALQYPFRKDEYEWNGIKVISLDNKREKNIRRPISWLKIWRQLRALHAAQKISGIFSFWCSECAFIGKRFGKQYAIPHYIWIPGQDARQGNKYIPLIKPKPNELVAISDSIADEFARNYGVKPAHILPNGIEPSLFSDVPAIRDIDLLDVGSLIPLKRHEIFIDSVKAISERLPGIKAVICGKGEEENKLKAKVLDMALSRNITFTGEKPHTEILTIMQRSKVLLHPSSYEGFSTVCLEALYAGAQVISFHKPVKGDMQNWHIVDTKEEMFSKALSILQNPNIAYTRVCKYTMDDNARAVIKLFGF